MKIKYCCVTKCGNNSLTHPSYKFHKFPRKTASYLYVTLDSSSCEYETIMDVRQIWELALLMKKSATEMQRVCSMHFQKTDYVFTSKQTLNSPHLYNFFFRRWQSWKTSFICSPHIEPPPGLLRYSCMPSPGLSQQQ